MPVLDKILESKSGFIILYHTCEYDEVDEKERLRKRILQQQQVTSPRMLYSWERVPLFSAAKRVVVKTIYDHTKERSLSITPKSSVGLMLAIDTIVPLESEAKFPIMSVVSEASKFIGSYFRTNPVLEQLTSSDCPASESKNKIIPRIDLKLTDDGDDSKQQWTINFSYIEQPRPDTKLAIPGIRLSLPTGTTIDHY